MSMYCRIRPTRPPWRRLGDFTRVDQHFFRDNATGQVWADRELAEEGIDVAALKRATAASAASVPAPATGIAPAVGASSAPALLATTGTPSGDVTSAAFAWVMEHPYLTVGALAGALLVLRRRR